MSSHPMIDETQLRSWLGQAEKALMEGRRSEALELVARARAAGEKHPDAIAACGVLTLQAGNPAEARTLIEQAIALNPKNPVYFVNLAVVLRAFNDAEGEIRACDRALALDPYFFTANLQKGSLYESQGDRTRAASAYHACLSSLRPGMQLPSAFRPLLDHAQEVVRARFRELEDWLQSRLEPLRRQFAGESLERVDDSLAILLGKKRVFHSQPTMTYFPRLPAISFFERRDFPWIEAIEAATPAIREELERCWRGTAGFHALRQSCAGLYRSGSGRSSTTRNAGAPVSLPGRHDHRAERRALSPDRRRPGAGAASEDPQARPDRFFLAARAENAHSGAYRFQQHAPHGAHPADRAAGMRLSRGRGDAPLATRHGPDLR